MSKKHKRNNNAKDTSPIVPQDPKIKEALRISERPLTEKQKKFIELALDKKTRIMFINGPSGTSKTWLSVYCALQMLNKKAVSDIVYVRSAVESSDESIGFLPGESSDKMAPYIQPLVDKLEEFLPKQQVKMLQQDKRISGVHVGFLRGLNFNAKALILDEAQNTSTKEIYTFLTRIGEFSKAFILGDPTQSDTRKTGFSKFINLFNDEESRNNGIHVFNFGKEDIVRSGVCRYIVDKFEKSGLHG